jgi:hypothetical protein
MYETFCWNEGAPKMLGKEGENKNYYLDGFGFIPKWLEWPHFELVH